METLFLRFVWLSATVSAVLLPLLLASRWIQRRVRAKSLYLLWLLLAIRLVIPVEISLPEPAVTVPVPQYEVTLPVQSNLVEPPSNSTIEPGVENPAIQQTPQAAQPEHTGVPVAVVLGGSVADGRVCHCPYSS